MVTVPDIAWAAGFLEGEGSFGRTRTCVHVEATQVNREPLDRLQNLFGGTVRTFRREAVKGTVYHRWDYYGQKAVGLMMTVFFLMSQKRKDKIIVALSAWKTSPGKGNYIRKH